MSHLSSKHFENLKMVRLSFEQIEKNIRFWIAKT